MRYILKEELDSPDLYELPLPFYGSKGDFIRIHNRLYKLRVIEFDYDNNTAWLFVDIIKK